MPPRLRIQANHIRLANPQGSQYVCQQCRHASMATATTPAAPPEQMMRASKPIQRYPTKQPPSYKPPEFRKTQLHRQYQSLLRSSPLMLLFQHNNLKAVEWMGIRRELAAALKKVDEEAAKSGREDFIGRDAKIQIVQTGIFASALKVVEFWNPNFDAESTTQHPTDPRTATSAKVADVKANADEPAFTHGLSKQAYESATRRDTVLRHGLEPLLSGPLAMLTIPTVSPAHLKAALSILAPNKQFPAPKRRLTPSYFEKPVQDGLQKLMLLGARVEGKVFDMDGTRWVGSIDGGLDGLRAQLVGMLQGAGAGITNTLEAAGRSLYVTVEGRRGMLEEEEKEKSE